MRIWKYMQNNSLIFGKDETKHIVSLEIKDDKTELFIQQEDGSITSEFRENKYWIVSEKPILQQSKRLEGNLFYKYYTQTGNKELFQKAKYEWKKDGHNLFVVNNHKEAFMIRNGVTYFKDLKHNNVSILSFDIETTGLAHDETSKVLLISNTYRDAKGSITRKLFSYDEHVSQGAMLKAWCEYVRETNPSILAGHNIFGYDLQYMQFIAEVEGISLDLGRDGSPITFSKYTSKFRIDGSRDLEYRSASIYGREIIDTMFLAYRYGVTKNYDSYGLKYLIKKEGLEKKNRTFYDASLIRKNYTIPKEWDKIKLYCSEDSDDSLSLYDLMGPALFYWAQSVPKSFQAITESATGSQINSMLIRAYLQEGCSLPKTSIVNHFGGGLSYAKPGIYKNHIRFDVASLYPSIILQYELYDKEKDPKGYYLELTRQLREMRLKNKKLAKETGLTYYKDMEQSQKVGINSIFGTAGAQGLLFNSPMVADAITTHGRAILTKGIEWVSGKSVTEWIPQDE